MTNRDNHLALKGRVTMWARRLSLNPSRISLRKMTRKWASCSASGQLVLARDLADQEVAVQDFVIVHELLHLKHPNHGRLFKAMLSLHVPGWRALEAQLPIKGRFPSL